MYAMILAHDLDDRPYVFRDSSSHHQDLTWEKALEHKPIGQLEELR